MNPPEKLTRRRILDALGRVGDELARHGVVGEIHLVGGAVLIVEYDARDATRDLDAVELRPHTTVLEAAWKVARDLGLPRSWLNDQASAFAPREADWRRSDVFDHPNLRLYAIEAGQLLAMKALAGRPIDVGDLRFLVGHLGLVSIDDALALVARHFPDDELGDRQRVVLEAAFDGEVPREP